MEKILSVSVAAYNAEQYIRECLESMLDEEIMRDLEILVINDGSKDQTPRIVEEYVNRFPESVILVNKDNGGWGSTVNESMRIATGKYYKLLDADDLFYKQNLKEYLTFLRQNDVDVVLTPYTIFDDENGEVYDRKQYDLEENKVYNYKETVGKVRPVMHAMTVNRNVIKKSGMHILDHCFYTDNQYVFELGFYMNTMKYYDKYIYNYRMGRNGQSCSEEGFVKHHEDMRRVLEYCMELYEKEKCDDMPAVYQVYLKKFVAAIIERVYFIYLHMDKEQQIVMWKDLQNYLVGHENLNEYITSLEVKLVLKLGRDRGKAVHKLFAFTRKKLNL